MNRETIEALESLEQAAHKGRELLYFDAVERAAGCVLDDVRQGNIDGPEDFGEALSCCAEGHPLISDLHEALRVLAVSPSREYWQEDGQEPLEAAQSTFDAVTNLAFFAYRRDVELTVYRRLAEIPGWDPDQVHTYPARKEAKS
jgi:hypothetical protein